MSLNASLQVGRSGLLVNQAAIQVTGNNLANVGTKGYHRQVVNLQPIPPQEIASGVFVGRGVQIASILRQVDEALEGRIRQSVADEAGSSAQSQILQQIESLHNELSGNDLSTQLGAFFDSWSNLANRPLDNSLRTLVLQQGQTLTSFIQDLRSGLADLRAQTDARIDQDAAAANDLLTQIEKLNQQVSTAEGGSDRASGNAAGLRDQRDALLTDLAKYLDISTVEQPSGTVDVFVGSTPLILNGESRGLAVRKTTVGGDLQIEVTVAADGTKLPTTTGELGALISTRTDDLTGAIDALDDFANKLIYQVNKVYSQGQGQTGFSSVTGTNKVVDATAALNDAAAELDFTPTHGSFQIHLTQVSTGQRVSSTINVDLDGIGSDTSLTGLAAAIDALSGVSATVTADKRLKISSDAPDFRISFSDDTSGALAAVGINTFFQGKDASNIGVNDVLNGDPSLVATAREGVSGDNRNALALSDLRDQPLGDLSGMSLSDFWSRHIEDYTIRLGQANQQTEAAGVVRQSLEAQQQSASGVNVDEETINLLMYQRAYQASARFLSVVDEMMQTLLAIT